MKKISVQILAVIFSAAVLINLAACNDDNDPGFVPTETIVGLAQQTGDLSTLVAVLTKYPDLVSTLNGSGNFTVFAPTNQAFEALLGAIGQTSIDDVPEDVVRTILEYHVIASGAFRSTDLTNSAVTTVSGEAVQVNVSGGVVLNGNTNVIQADIEATNGIIHVINNVLVNPSITPIVGTIVAPAYFNKNFTTLIAAVQAADGGILEALLAPGTLTLFAPTNDAFDQLPDGLVASLLQPANQGLLNNVLLYHALGATVGSADLPQGSAAIETLAGTFYLSNNANGVFINGTTRVVATDITGSNGVVHVIDRTLVPPTETIAEIAVGLATGSSPEFTQLVAALQRVPDLLNAAANTEANLTVFAPTDAAFEALLTALELESVDDIPLDVLTAVLQHHIVGARVFSTDLSSGAVPTLNGDITVNVSNLTITDGQGEAANLLTSLLNVHGINGVIHVIDRVLLPE
ncbi:MAG TPA: fasciclin domain-containing protein [Cyclobacteriaceae bacterium]|nr:fasciclin domain-containing protein [Cyclobacteriaceae bacterium]